MSETPIESDVCLCGFIGDEESEPGEHSFQECRLRADLARVTAERDEARVERDRLGLSYASLWDEANVTDAHTKAQFIEVKRRWDEMRNQRNAARADGERWRASMYALEERVLELTRERDTAIGALDAAKGHACHSAQLDAIYGAMHPRCNGGGPCSCHGRINRALRELAAGKPETGEGG